MGLLKRLFSLRLVEDLSDEEYMRILRVHAGKRFADHIKEAAEQ